MSRLVALDTETTGLDPSTEAVFEIAAVPLDGDDEHVWTIEPDPHIVEAMHPKAAEVNRYHQRTTADYWYWDLPLTGTREDTLGVLNGIRHVLDGAHIIGAVPDFDTRFLTALYRQHNVTPPRWHYHLIDVEVLAVGWILSRSRLLDVRADWCLACGVCTDEESGYNVCPSCVAAATSLPYKSDDLAAIMGIDPPSTDERHTALGDARWVARWYRTMTGDPDE